MNKIYYLFALLMVLASCRVDEGDNDQLNGSVWEYRSESGAITEVHTITFNQTTFKYYITEEVYTGQESAETYIVKSYSGTYLYTIPYLYLSSIEGNEQMLENRDGQLFCVSPEGESYFYLYSGDQ